MEFLCISANHFTQCLTAHLEKRWTDVGWLFSCHLDGSEKVEQTATRVLISVAVTTVICSEGQTQGQGYSNYLVNMFGCIKLLGRSLVAP